MAFIIKKNIPKRGGNMLKNKKGQAAMEFLMTYGWAILVVLAAIAALAYFGVLSPDRFLPEKCTMPSGIACLDFAQDGNDVVLSIQNAAGFDMSNVSVGLTSDEYTIGCTPTTANVSLANGQKRQFTVNCVTLPAAGAKLKAAVSMDYINPSSGLDHTASGELIMKTQ